MTGDRYRAQVDAALGAVAVRPPEAFLWFGRLIHAHGSLADTIQRRLLTDFYGAAEPRPHLRSAPTRSDDGGSFVGALSQANCGRGSWHSGWRVAADDDDTITVVRPDDGLALLAPAQDCRVEGAQAQVRVPKDLMGLSPGLYVALADTPWPAGADERVGLHWNVAAFGAVTLVKRVTFALNRAELAFRIELLDDPARYRHGSGATLLLARADYAAAIALLRPLLRALGPHLADAAPAFTKPLARGLAVAEEPGDGLHFGEHFGEHRCRLLAGAIVAAGRCSTRRRLAVVEEHFHAAGLSLDAPYLQPGSDDAYELS